MRAGGKVTCILVLTVSTGWVTSAANAPLHMPAATNLEAETKYCRDLKSDRFCDVLATTNLEAVTRIWRD